MIRKNLSVSNIGWSVSHDVEIRNFLQKNNIHFIDIAPGKYFRNFNQSSSEIKKLKDFWLSNDIEIIGIQGIFFNRPQTQIFSTKRNQIETLNYLKTLYKLAKELGVRKITFGSPRNRVVNTLTKAEIQAKSTYFFKSLGDISEVNNITTCLEANPKIYGADYLTQTLDAIEEVNRLEHPNIKLQLDTGTILINNESLNKIIEKGESIVHHIHVSRKNLAPLDKNDKNHKIFSKAFKEKFPSAEFISLEQKEFDIDQIKTSIQEFVEIYSE